VRGGLPIRFRHRHESRMRMVVLRTRLDHRHGQVLGMYFILRRAERGLRRDGARRRRRRGRVLLRTAAGQNRARDQREGRNARHYPNVAGGPLGS
jgi:hypothetical protein